MIIKKQGNILEGDWDGIVHCANLYHTMGSGIALQIKRKWPIAVIADKQTPHGDSTKLGGFSHAKAEDTDNFPIDIFNLYAQVGIGNNGIPINRNFQYDHFYNGLWKICERIKDGSGAWTLLIDGVETAHYILALPKIGCGLAGGDIKIVTAIIESIAEHFPTIEFHLYL